MNEKFNVADIMRSKSFREYYKDIELPIEKQIAIIITSYRPLWKQLEYLQLLLGNASNDEDEKKITDMISLYEFILKLFHNPQEIYPDNKIFYIKSKNSFLYNKFDNINFSEKVRRRCSGYDVYDNINDILNWHKNQNDSYNIDIELYIIRDNKTISPISFDCGIIDNEFAPYRCFIDSSEYNFIEDIIDVYNRPNYRFDSPFNNKDKVKIELPGLNKPIIGTLSKEYDQQNCPYQFLEDIDLSYTEINFTYSKFDFVDGVI